MWRVTSILLILSFSVGAVAMSSRSHRSYRSSYRSRSYAHRTRSRSTRSKTYRSHHFRSHKYPRGYAAPGYTLHSSVQRDSHGRIKRSAAARDAFKRQQPCPSTGRRSGACPGYVVDHVRPLECGGADAPSNMQWQTTAAAKTKDKTERYCR